MISNKLILVGYEFIPAIGLCVGWEKRTDYTDTVNNKGPQLLLIFPLILYISIYLLIINFF